MHWHIINWNNRFGTIGVITYDNAPKSINDFLDMSLEIFKDQVDATEDERAAWGMKMLDFSEVDMESELLGTSMSTHISHSSEKLNISWVNCYENPCSFAVYN
jgi:hypothetical protein